MLIEFHCTCGHRQALAVDKLKPAVRCGACKAVLRFVPQGKKVDAAVWLAVGGQTGPPRLAVPVPVGAALAIGRAASGWLALPGEEIEEAQTELQIEDDGKLHVKHLSGDSGTWINRARIVTGVLGREDKLRVGPYVMRLMTQSAVQEASSSSIEPEVIVETDESAAPAAKPKRRRAAAAEPEVEVIVEDEEAVDKEDEAPYSAVRWSTGQKVRAVVCGVIILGAGLFLTRSFIWPPLSDDMPQETDFYCPVDGNVVRGVWTAATGAPICPLCGQRCVGELRYKTEPLHPLPADEPAEGEPDSAEQASGETEESADTIASEAGDGSSLPMKGDGVSSPTGVDAAGKADASKKKGRRPKRASREDKGGAS